MHVAIAGNIGAGKTTLTQLLAKHYKWEAQLEDVVDNPYLDDFYNQMERWLINHETISSEEAKQILINISKGNYNQSQIASFLTVFMMRSITLDELKGFRNALLELCVPVDLSAYNPIDLCGTGGDGKDTFNISTLSSFVTAAAGIPVAKHGNYGVSSACGSSNVLESLGVTFSNDVKFLERAIETSGICVLHAP